MYIILIVIIILSTLFNQLNKSNKKYMNKQQLEKNLLGSILIHISRSNPNKIYKIHYFHNNTFKIDTILEGKIQGETKGTFSIKENQE